MFLEKYRYVHYPPTQVPRFELDVEKCTHCQACYKACPTSCIQWDETKRLPYATGLGGMEIACLACNNCEAVCPAGAVKVRGAYRVLKGRYKTPDDRFAEGEMLPPMPFGEKDLNRSFDEIEKELNETERVIYRRRSIRLFKDKPVPRELIHRILEAARWAPSGGNCTPWKFIVVDDKEMIERIDRECAKPLYALQGAYYGKNFKRLWRKILVYLLSYLMIGKMDQRPIAAIEKAKRLNGSICFGAPVVIHVLKDVRGIGDPEFDTGIACQNLVIAAHSLGLGTLYVGLIKNGLKYLPRLKKELGIGYPYDLSISICVGYPRGKLDNPVYRDKLPVVWLGKDKA